jgi:hypothetical protein
MVATLHRPRVPVAPDVRRRLRSRRGVAVLAAVAVAAVVFAGPLGVLGAVMLVLVACDALLPMPGDTRSEADDHFRRLVRERRREQRRARLRLSADNRLDVLDDRTGWAAVAQRRALGVRPVPLDAITGTVEGAKAAHFDRAFRPAAIDAERWKGVWMADARGVPLPPVSAYLVDGRYVVRDGHHRVSVARERGAAAIDGDVVELLRPR